MPIADDEKVLVLQFLESGLPVLVSAAGVKFVCGFLSKFGIVLKNILKAEHLGYGGKEWFDLSDRVMKSTHSAGYLSNHSSILIVFLC